MGRMFSDQFVQNAMALGEKWREQRKMGKITNAMSTWGQDPDGAIQKVMQIDPHTGVELQQQKDLGDYRRSLAAAQAEETATKQRADRLGSLKTVVGLLDGVGAADPAKFGSAFDQLTPIMRTSLGMSDADIAQARGALQANPGLIKTLKQRLDPEKPILSAPGSELLSPEGDVLHSTPATPKGAQIVQVRGGDGSVKAYAFDPTSGVFYDPTTGRPEAGPGVGGGAGGGGSGPLTAQDAWGFISKQEGGYSPSDGNGHPSNFGFNQKWNPDIDVSKLTPETAAQRYASTRFPADQVAAMPRPLALAYADSYFRNPGKAKQWLADSGGDVNKFMQLREAWDSKQPSADVYAQRNAALREAIGATSGGAGGGNAMPEPVITAPGKPVAKARQLSDDEIDSRNLDPAYQWQEMPNGETKIIGPAHKVGKLSDQQNKIKTSADMVAAQLDNTVKTIDQLYNHPGLSRITGVMGSLPDYPGGHAADADALLTTLKSQIGLNVLQALRSASPTGGALGRVSNFEMQTLQENLAALKKTQSLGQFQDQLTRLKSNLMQMRQRVLSAAHDDISAPTKSGGGGGPQVNIPAPAIDALKANPTGAMRLQFDQKYGRGKAKQILGTASITTDMPIGQTTPYGTRI